MTDNVKVSRIKFISKYTGCSLSDSETKYYPKVNSFMLSTGANRITRSIVDSCLGLNKKTVKTNKSHTSSNVLVSRNESRPKDVYSLALHDYNAWLATEKEVPEYSKYIPSNAVFLKSSKDISMSKEQRDKFEKTLYMGFGVKKIERVASDNEKYYIWGIDESGARFKEPIEFLKSIELTPYFKNIPDAGSQTYFTINSFCPDSSDLSTSCSRTVLRGLVTSNLFVLRLSSKAFNSYTETIRSLCIRLGMLEKALELRGFSVEYTPTCIVGLRNTYYSVKELKDIDEASY